MAGHDDEDGVERNDNGSVSVPEGHDYSADNAVNRALDRDAQENNLRRPENPSDHSRSDGLGTKSASAPDDFERKGPLDRGAVNAGEANPSANNPFGYTANERKIADSPPRSKARSWGKRGGISIGIAGIGIAGILSLSSVSLVAPLHFLEILIPGLDTATAALTKSHQALFRVKTKVLGNTKAATGCTVLSIRCKWSSMSKSQVARYNRAGLVFETEPFTILGKEVPERVRLKSASYKGTTYNDPTALMNAIDNNVNGIRVTEGRASSMRYLGMAAGRFVNSVLMRFGIDKQKPGLKGSTSDRINQLLTAAGTSNVGDLVFTDVVDENGKVTGYKLQGDASGKIYTVAERDAAIAKIAKYVKTESRPSMQKLRAVQSSPAFGQLVKAASITGIADVACSINNMIGLTAIAAKINTQVALIKLWQPVFALIQAMKAGESEDAGKEISADDVAAVATILTKVDEQKEIANPNGDGSTIPNPSYNTSALDSPLVGTIADGQVRQTTAETDQLTGGLSVEKMLGAVGGAYVYFNDLLSKNGCKLVQNWIVRGVGIAVGIVAAIGTAGGELAFQVGTIAALMGVMYVIQVGLNTAIHGPDVQASFDNGESEAIGSGAYVAMNGIMGAHAQSAGLEPGSVSEIVDYQSTVAEVNNDYIAIEKEDAKNTPFDIKNQYSLLGAAARTFGSATTYSSSPISLIRGVIALATGRVKDSTSTAYASASLNAERFLRCPDKAQKVVGYNADMDCNPRFIQTPAVTALVQDPEGTAQWMEDNGYVDKDTTTGLPSGGFQVPNTGVEQAGLVAAIAGAASSFVNQFVNTTNYGIGVAVNYGKYLYFCAYRVLPYGEQYTEDGAINSVGDDWLTGKACKTPTTGVTADALNHFKAYSTLLVADMAESDETEMAGGAVGLPGTIGGPLGTCPAGSSVVPEIRQGYWNGSYQAATFCAIDNTSDNSLDGIRDSAVFKANNAILQTNATGKVVVIDKAAQDMVNLVNRYGKTFSTAFSYRSHNLQCIMYYYDHNLSTLPSECSGLTKAQADSIRSQMSGVYEMDGSFYTSKHESGTALDVNDLNWVNTCARDNYDGTGSGYCFNFVSLAIEGDEEHVDWKGN